MTDHDDECRFSVNAQGRLRTPRHARERPFRGRWWATWIVVGLLVVETLVRLLVDVTRLG